MILQSVLDLHFGGSGSGCHGENCGRPAEHKDTSEPTFKKIDVGTRTIAGKYKAEKFEVMRKGETIGTVHNAEGYKEAKEGNRKYVTSRVLIQKWAGNHRFESGTGYWRLEWKNLKYCW